MQITILSGVQGSGKTTYLQQFAASAARWGKTVGGIASPAVFEGGRRVGYDLLDLRSGCRRPLARLDNGLPAPTKIGVYAFDDAAIAEGNDRILDAVKAGASIIVVDEIGPLEFRGGGWSRALAFAIEKCATECELILTIRPSLADDLAARFPSPFWQTARRVVPPWPALGSRARIT